MTQRFAELSFEEKKRLCDALLNRRVSLFTGSGVSVDSSGPHGPMRLAGKLKDDLVSITDIPASSSLQQAYSMLTTDEIEREITTHYTCQRPGQSAKTIANLPWRRVYTLNVDDSYESAFEELILQKEFDSDAIEIFNFKDSFAELSPDKRASVIHLHGTVRRSQEGYVFSRNEYAKSISQPNSWMLTLSQLIRTDTFVVAGTSLDEIDVEFYLEQRSQRTIRSDVPPSVLVEPFPSRLTEKLCRDHEFVLFEGTINDFVAELVQIDPRLKDPWHDSQKDGLENLGFDHTQRLKFSLNFEAIPKSPEKTAHPARFLLGAELSWSMVAANSDIPRECFPQIRDYASSWLEDHEFRLVVLLDEAGTGKTSFLMRLAYEFNLGSYATFWYTGRGMDLDASVTASIIDRIPHPTLIFVDDFADALNEISLILAKLKRRDVLFVCAERDYRRRYIENAFTGEDYQVLPGALGLTEAEAEKLLDVSTNEGISTIGKLPRQAYLKQVVGRSIAEANCRIQNNFGTIDSIIKSLQNECSPKEQQTFLITSLARFCFGAGVLRSVLSTISHPETVEFLLSDEAALLIKYSDELSGYLVPKNSVVGDRLLETAKRGRQKELLTAFKELALSLAPRVTPKTIRKKTPEAQLLGRLMDYDSNVRRYIDDFAEEYYSSLKQLCGWNARYWEQMSLLKLDRYLASPADTALLEESIQHARVAVAAEIHPFSLTTLAKVLFRAMEASATGRDQYFAEAWSCIVDADTRESHWPSRGATLFFVCFNGVMAFSRLGGQISGQQHDKLREMVRTADRLRIRDHNFLDLIDRIKSLLDP